MTTGLPVYQQARHSASIWLCLLFLVILSSCGTPEEGAQPLPPVAIEAGDECHVCGMIITNFPGPKGEAYVRNRETALKFCSTRDLFSYLLQPENKANVTRIFVHDMGVTDWQLPADTAFVDAREAWYVIDQPWKGAMGPTLASFKSRKEAERFIEEHGGKMLRFEDITLEVLATLGVGEPKK